MNAGITGFHLRRLPLEPDRAEAFVQVHATGPAPVDVALEVRLDGALTGVRRFVVPPGGRERLLLPFAAGQGRVLALRAVAAGDCLAADDALTARLPEPRPVRVLWVAPEPDPFTALAFAALAADGALQVRHAAPADWPPRAPADATVFDGWLPEEWPAAADVPAAIVIDPPRALGPVTVTRLPGAGLPLDGVRATAPRHALLFGVASARVAVTQTAAIAATGPLEPLWMGPAGPVLAAGEVRGQRVAVLGCVPARSERLPLTASFPLLVGNAIYWATQPREEAGASAHHATGELVAARGTRVTWSGEPGDSPDTEAPLAGGVFEADRTGLWRTDAGAEGSASLLAAPETLLPEPTAAEPAGSARPGGGEWTTALLWGVLAVLVIESGLYHRLGVH